LNCRKSMAKKKSLEWRNCSEEELASKVLDFAPSVLTPGVLILLEGEMGAGKSTFARAVVSSLCKRSRSQGSPTFPLVQEYRADAGFPIYHMDLYRLKSEEELEHSGIAEQIDARDALVMVECASMFPGFFRGYSKGGSKRTVFTVEIAPEGESRSYRITSS